MNRITAHEIFEGRSWNVAKACNPLSEQQRAEIDDNVAQFLSRGGKITEVPSVQRINDITGIEMEIKRRGKKK